ncbi:hypothetical protein [Sphingomonas sp. STIS6.2]|uniref:hypothetical protein n=1 Tax=Sphingomonas sp. STIS6.2 TaxID=1379700 RepID=UPI00131DF661|nr:hypothetical protein [Sphingomonas sp. STIS6.2]
MIVPSMATMDLVARRLGAPDHKTFLAVAPRSMQDCFRLACELAEAIKPFATARIDDDHGRRLADWHAQHDSDGVSLRWDPEFDDGSTLTIGQFKRARAAFQGAA